MTRAVNHQEIEEELLPGMRHDHVVRVYSAAQMIGESHLDLDRFLVRHRILPF